MTSSLAEAAPSTQQRLVAAAAAEFNSHGYGGTDSNKIARRAGFAPQTFYRWFKDKAAIFIAVYQAWEEAERQFVGDLVRQGAGDAAVIERAVQHHRDYRLFRRSLRTLALEDPAVREARAQSRLRQVERIARASAGPGARPEITVRLLELERLCDALAEGELADLGQDETAARARLAAILAEMRGL